MIIYIIVIILLLYCIFKERQALGCQHYVWQGKDCDNQQGKAVRGTQPFPQDSTDELLSKIRYAAAYGERVVVWRIFMILAIIICTLIIYVLYKRIPSEYEFVIFILVIFTCCMATKTFYSFHQQKLIRKNIENAVDQIYSHN